MQHGGADVGNDVVGLGQRGVAQQRDDRLQPAPGDVNQPGADQGAAEQVAQAPAHVLGAGQHGAVKVGREHQGGGGFNHQLCGGCNGIHGILLL